MFLHVFKQEYLSKWKTNECSKYCRPCFVQYCRTANLNWKTGNWSHIPNSVSPYFYISLSHVCQGPSTDVHGSHIDIIEILSVILSFCSLRVLSVILFSPHILSRHILKSNFGWSQEKHDNSYNENGCDFGARYVLIFLKHWFCASKHLLFQIVLIKTLVRNFIPQHITTNRRFQQIILTADRSRRSQQLMPTFESNRSAQQLILAYDLSNWFLQIIATKQILTIDLSI